MERRKFLEVFSGENRSCLGWALENNMEYHSADIRSFDDYIPTYHGDVRAMDIPFEEYDIVWLSPSCVTWGRMAMSRKCRNPHTLEPLTATAREDTDVMNWVVEQIPRMKIWIIENPVGWMKRYMEIMVPDAHVVKATYCMYDCNFWKPTHFFSNIPIKPCLVCSRRGGATTCRKTHRNVRSGSNRPSLMESHKIPQRLIRFLLDDVTNEFHDRNTEGHTFTD